MEERSTGQNIKTYFNKTADQPWMCLMGPVRHRMTVSWTCRVDVLGLHQSEFSGGRAGLGKQQGRTSANGHRRVTGKRKDGARPPAAQEGTPHRESGKCPPGTAQGHILNLPPHPCMSPTPPELLSLCQSPGCYCFLMGTNKEGRGHDPADGHPGTPGASLPPHRTNPNKPEMRNRDFFSTVEHTSPETTPKLFKWMGQQIPFTV